MESKRRLAMTTDAAVCLRVCVCVYVLVIDDNDGQSAS